LAFERHFGSPLRHMFEWIEKKYMAPVKIHPIGWRKPEEDEASLLYIYSTFFLYFVYPFEDLFEPFFYFDQKMAAPVKERIMRYYRTTVQRHLFANRVGSRHFLSKNPGFTPKVEALHHRFPDARFIFLVRDPVENVPSAMKLFSIAYKLFNDPPEEYPHKDFFIKIFNHWYLHPLETLAVIPPEQWMILKYEDLAKDLEGTIQNIYTHFGLELEESFLETIREIAQKGKEHVSVTSGELERQGFSAQQIREIFSEVVEKFGY
jgi:omega-hydroxy-beta-dihydromenaquinone-9 sulfotransferase